MSPCAVALTPFALALALALAPTPAAAHPGPATPPTFAPDACIKVVDLRTTQALDLKYDVVADDNIFGVGEIQLVDAKTHQFFSFAGVIAKHAAAAGYQLFPFDATLDQPASLPLWLEQTDVKRAAAATTPADMTGFTASQVDAGEILALRPDLTALVHAIDGGTARVPITKRQAEQGVHWDLRAQAPGLYSVAGYVFSPPYNDWAARAGIVKLVDGNSAVPAAVIEPIDKTLFAGQGRRVKGCVDAPSGSTLSTWVRAEDQPNAPWEAWLVQEPLASVSRNGTFELCLRNPDAGRSAVLRVRLEVSAPDGQRSAAYSPDTLLVVATPAPCTPSEDICCAERAPLGDGGPDVPPAAPTDAGAPDAAGAFEAGAQLDASGPGVDAEQREPEAPAPSAGDTERGEAAGCSVRADNTNGCAWFALALLCAGAWRRPRRA